MYIEGINSYNKLKTINISTENETTDWGTIFKNVKKGLLAIWEWVKKIIKSILNIVISIGKFVLKCANWLIIKIKNYLTEKDEDRYITPIAHCITWLDKLGEVISTEKNVSSISELCEYKDENNVIGIDYKVGYDKLRLRLKERLDGYLKVALRDGKFTKGDVVVDYANGDDNKLRTNTDRVFRNLLISYSILFQGHSNPRKDALVHQGIQCSYKDILKPMVTITNMMNNSSNYSTAQDLINDIRNYIGYGYYVKTLSDFYTIRLVWDDIANVPKYVLMVDTNLGSNHHEMDSSKILNEIDKRRCYDFEPQLNKIISRQNELTAVIQNTSAEINRLKASMDGNNSNSEITSLLSKCITSLYNSSNSVVTESEKIIRDSLTDMHDIISTASKLAGPVKNKYFTENQKRQEKMVDEFRTMNAGFNKLQVNTI